MTLRSSGAHALVGALFFLMMGTPERLHAQGGTDIEAIPDSIFMQQAQELPRPPITYFTTYDLNVSRSSWMQNLHYDRPGPRVSFGFDAGMNTYQPVGVLQTEGMDGSIAGKLSFRATPRWLWSLDGLFDMSTNEDPGSSTKKRQNKVQVRSQYSTTLLPGLSGTGLIFTELQQEQGLGRKTIRYIGLGDGIGLDSTYASGRRDGVSGTLNWSPKSWLEVTGVGSGNWNHLTTRVRQREYKPDTLNGGLALSLDSSSVSTPPTGDERYETRAYYRGIPKTTFSTTLRSLNGTQTMYAFTQRGLDTLSWYDRTANITIEHAPAPGTQVSFAGSFAQAFREYKVQNNYDNLGRTYSASANFLSYQLRSRAAAGFQLARVRNDNPDPDIIGSTDGLILNRDANASLGRQITSKLWLEGAGKLTLFSRRYENPLGDRDDLRGYINVGGGYRVSSVCSTAVHFSVNRSHVVAVAALASANNNVQTSYQMDALLRLRLGQNLQILQNYQINANYFIYDFDFREPQNTLSRIRRIDTVVSDTLFDFAFLRLTHNFSSTDRGSYTRIEEDGPRKYGVATEQYVQNLTVMMGVRPFHGVLLTVSQSLGNTRTYDYTVFKDFYTNRWGLNVAAHVDRTLPGDMQLQGSIQHIGEYTEEDVLPMRDEVDQWLAGASLMKNF